MRNGQALTGLAVVMGLALASCSYASRAVIRNESGADVLLWPLSERPMPLKAGEAGTPFVYSGYTRQEALLERGGCLHTYPAPEYSTLPKRLRNGNSQVVVVINPDMSLSVRERSKKGVEGPEIAAPGFPLRPSTFCGKRGEG